MSTFERLPSNIIPNCYNLTFEPNFEQFTFSGIEDIELEVKQSTNKIILNAIEFTIGEVTYEPAHGCKLIPQDVTLDKEDERLIITFSSNLTPGLGTLHISFNGILNDKLKGFYRAKYPTNDENSSDRFVAVTQFASTYARYAFPSWDEPAIKATFKVTLVAPPNTLALSNMPSFKEDIREDGKRVVRFEESPIMSTYLLAFIIGQFDFVESVTKNKVNVRVYTSPGKKEQGQFALDVAVKSLDFYAEYFNTAYPLPKMDLVSISEFACGAMENWGLSTFRETAILVDPEKTSADRKQRIALTVAHEMAHQWFGNLTTMEWWTHLWLNEGFATFMEYLCVESFLPEYSVWKQFVCNEYSTALKLDGLNSSHLIEVHITSPSQIDEIFDAISYSKGASIIAMLHNYIGDLSFKRGMSAYLNKFGYKNAKTEDLWNSLEIASGKPVKDVMTSWTKLKGYPVLSVSESSNVSNSRVLKITQEKFVANGMLLEEEKSYKWMVPISIITSASPNKCALYHLMYNFSDEVVVQNVSSNDWIKLNQDSIGVYRVAYTESMLEALMPAIESKLLPPLDRLNILDDLFALMTAGKASTVQFLKILQSYINEDDYNVWSTLTSCICKLNSLLSHSDLQKSYQSWANPLLRNVRTVGWTKDENEDHSRTLLRLTILETLNALNDETILLDAEKLFDEHLNQNRLIPPDIRSVVYKAVAKKGHKELYATFLKMYRETDFAEEKNKLLAALSGIEDKHMLQDLLQFAISPEVRSQESILVIATVAGNKHGRELAWTFFKENFSYLKEKYSSLFLGNTLVKSVTGVFASENKAVEVETFFDENNFPGTERAVKQSVESIRISTNWLSRDLEQVRAYLINDVQN